jgi:hypothetical protein
MIDSIHQEDEISTIIGEIEKCHKLIESHEHEIIATMNALYLSFRNKLFRKFGILVGITGVSLLY